MNSVQNPRAYKHEEFGRKLKAFANEKGWSQSELARQAGLARDSVSTYVRGVSFPDPENFAKLCKALGVSADQLGDARSAPPAEFSGYTIRSLEDKGKASISLKAEVTIETAAKILELLQSDSIWSEKSS